TSICQRYSNCFRTRICGRSLDDKRTMIARMAVSDIPIEIYHVKLFGQEVIRRSDLKPQDLKEDIINNFDTYYDCPAYTKSYLKYEDIDYSIKFDDDLLNTAVE